jgi:hypothetical protein
MKFEKYKIAKICEISKKGLSTGLPPKYISQIK